MQNFSKNGNSGLDITKLPSSGRVISLNNVVKEKLDKIIKHKHLINDVFAYKDGYFTVKNSNESSVLTDHFKGIPIVPGVIFKLLLLSLIKGENINKTDSLYCKTSFFKSGVPGSKVFLGTDGLSLVDENGEKYIQIELIKKFKTVEQAHYIDGFKKITEMKPKNLQELSGEELDKYLLQSGKFRFANNALFTIQKEKGNIGTGDIFSGQHNISMNDILFLDTNGHSKNIYHGFYEEIAAQIGSLAMREVLGEVTGNKSKIITFKESVFKFDKRKIKERLKANSKINVIGIVINRDKRYITFIYIGKNEKGENLFRGEISGNIISSKILSKLPKI